jgi:hypothetical protein
MDLADYVFGAALASVIGCNIYFGTCLMRESTAIEWGLTSRTSWHVPTWLAVWGAPVFMIGVRFLIWLSSVFAPITVLGIQTSVVMFSVIFATAHISMLLRARQADEDSFGS